jgi:DeoR family transcriptional regulator of aga operon
VRKTAKRKKAIKPAEDLQSAQSREPQEQRTQFILRSLQENGSVVVEELAEKLNVTVVTIRRDLDHLEQQGLLRRNHGGAVSIDPLFYEPFKKDRSFLAQVERQANEKRRIGRAAAALISPGETIAITPGTTTAEIIRGLPLNSRITVVTNTANIAMELSKRKDISVFVTGGHLHGDWFSLVGPTAIRSLENMIIHTMFIGADGIDPQWGLSCFSPDEAELNAAMVRRSRRHVAVVDHTKLGVVADWKICEIGTINKLITDTEATDELVTPFQSVGIEVVRV